MDVDRIEDDLQRHATLTQIRSYGQTPRRLFSKPHIARQPLAPERPVVSMACPATVVGGGDDGVCANQD